MKNGDKFNQLVEYLGQQNIVFELIKHKPIFSVEDGLKELGIDASQGFSTLLMKGDGEFLIILRRDDNQMSFGKIKKALGIKNLEFATKDEVVQMTGCEVGYVSPYNSDIKAYIDDKILEKDFVFGGTGSPEHDLKVSPTELMKISQSQPINICKDQQL